MAVEHAEIGFAYLLKAIALSPDGRASSGLPLRETEHALDHFAVAAFKQGVHPPGNWSELVREVINEPYCEWPSYLQGDLLEPTDRLIQFGKIPDQTIKVSAWVSELADDEDYVALRNSPDEIEENQFFNEMRSYCQSQEDPQRLYVELRRYLVSSVSKTEDEMIDFLSGKPKELRGLIDKAYYIADTAPSDFACKQCGAPSIDCKPHPQCRDCISMQSIEVRKYESGEKVLRGRIASAFYFRSAIDVNLFEEFKRTLSTCELWPNLDLDGDVSVKFPNGDYWIFDCKDYLYPRSLIRKVSKERFTRDCDRFIYVIPDRVGEVYLQQARDALPNHNFLFFNRAIASVKDKVRRIRSART
ncbi:hypothetical protein XM38_031010 [Halomicronema hongdechloris C2206]|uniref:REase associating with pPIWI RE domain-containing protein n=1 Tax=Halomicronema hongdechloris C2206 TaxID=1641165 RepID=A0A1Z3HPQ0_9CYAN|nr:hypothetical protein [Halomicronema hongdechloris]ASC72147.1 hypothetical protein XM38_031010 [Halomicronema hongdechloris C2206]